MNANFCAASSSLSMLREGCPERLDMGLRNIDQDKVTNNAGRMCRVEYQLNQSITTYERIKIIITPGLWTSSYNND
uniref:Uncharacterized protein n=1 Tax=Romanomermis culicivorax TaxID=13658 RepID=A0A915IFX0_ROMCU